MDILHSVVLGIVEGMTEFLPVSSTFHLLWTSRILGVTQTEFVKLFEVVIQSGAIAAVALLYAKEILTNSKLFFKIIFSFIPTAIIGYLLYGIIKNVFFESMLFTTGVFIAVGVLFILVELFLNKYGYFTKKRLSEMSYKDAFLIGIFQSLAVIPGVSRAGAVILGMLCIRFDREQSAKYSFMISLPTILAASLLDLYKMKNVLASDTGNYLTLIVGGITAFVVSYFVVKWLIKYLQNNSLEIFGWYRILVGIILLLAFYK